MHPEGDVTTQSIGLMLTPISPRFLPNSRTMTSWNGTASHVTSPGGFHHIRPVMRSVGVRLFVSPNKLSDKQSSFGWFKTPWRSCDITIQSSAVITRSVIVRYHLDNYRNWGRISIKCWIHKRHPIPRPNGRAMRCLLWIFVRKMTAL